MGGILPGHGREGESPDEPLFLHLPHQLGMALIFRKRCFETTSRILVPGEREAPDEPKLIPRKS